MCWSSHFQYGPPVSAYTRSVFEGLLTKFRALHRAIVKPLPPLKPGLPWFLLVSFKLQQHIPTLKPFLDSLPSPFHWRLETREESEALDEGIFKKNEKGVRKGLESAEKLKNAGNAAFARKDRSAALEAYSEAIEDIFDALSQKPDVEDEKKAKRQLAICYANRAAAHLMAGGGADAKKAIQDGNAAEATDPSYSKAYVRQASGYKLMENLEGAKDSISRALRRTDLQDDSGLVNILIGLYTDGKGFSDDEEVFKSLMIDILINDRASSDRLRGLGGEWRRRCDVQFAKWKR